MSVVVAIKEDNKIYMAADTMVTYGDGRRYLKTPHTQKIWVVKDTPNCIMGCVGMLCDLNVVRYCSDNLVPELAICTNNINIGTIIQNTVPQIFGLITDYNEVCSKDKDVRIQSSFLLGVQDHLFAIYSDGCVEEEEDFVAIGSGADLALASLEGSAGEDIQTRLFKALSAASYSLYVDDPYVFVDNDKCKLSVGTYEDLSGENAGGCDSECEVQKTTNKKHSTKLGKKIKNKKQGDTQ